MCIRDSPPPRRRALLKLVGAGSQLLQSTTPRGRASGRGSPQTAPERDNVTRQVGAWSPQPAPELDSL
eukprot:2977144-Alexandrium_andersonii.AAC.1